MKLDLVTTLLTASLMWNSVIDSCYTDSTVGTMECVYVGLGIGGESTEIAPESPAC